MALHQHAEPGHAGGDQQRVGHGADQTYGQDVLAQQPLAQDEGVLRPDGEDQAQSEEEAFAGGSKQTASAPVGRVAATSERQGILDRSQRSA